MKSWKSGFFLIYQRAIPDYMSWRHPSSAIDDLKPPTGLENSDLRSDYQGFLMEMENPHHDIRPTLQRLPFYCTFPNTADPVILGPTIKDLAAGTPSAKVIAKAEASKKQKASLFAVAPIHVAKRTRSISLINPISSAIVIPTVTPPKWVAAEYEVRGALLQ
nr:hypothetical protein [Tanacetum cinerariifolium]